MEETPEVPKSIFERINADMRQIPGWLYRNGAAMFYAVAGADNEPRMHEYDSSADDSATIERINRRGRALARERTGLRLWRTLIIFGSAGIPIVFLLTVPQWEGGTIRSLHWVLGACLIFAQLFLLITLLFVRARVASLNAQLQILEYENVLTSFSRGHEKRAATLFFKHQTELNQYYDQTLRQNKQSFVLGVVCIGFGLATVGVVATLLVVHPDSATPAKVAAGALGIMSALLTGFVARIFLGVYEGSAEALVSFHKRLVNTNHYHFSSLVISMIEPKAERMSALSDLARVIAAPQPAAKTED
ncbi:MAG: hypothetical protein WD810_01855 [Solirubrobacterales bacterium]